MEKSLTINEGAGTELVVTEEHKTITQAPMDVFVTVEVPQPAPKVLVRYGHDAVHVLMSEIALTIRDVSLIELINDNYGLITEERNVRIDENNVIAEDILTIKAQLVDPNTGNTALGTAIDGLRVELHNHEGAMDAHATKFTQLEVSIDDIADDVQLNAQAVSDLSVDVSNNRDGWMANAQDIVNLKISVDNNAAGIHANASFNQSNYVKIMANENGININGEAIDTLNGSIEETNANVTLNASAINGIKIELHDDTTGLWALSSRITELSAGVSGTFNPVFAWEFTHDTEGWQAGGGASLSQADDALIVDCSTAPGYTYINLESAISGADFPLFLLRWKRLTGSSWVGKIYYKYSGGPSNWTEAKSFSEPINAVDYVMTNLDLRNTAWTSRQITAIAIELANTDNVSFAFDSIGIGRVGALGPYAYIKDNLNAWVNEDSAMAQRITELEVSVGENHGLITDETIARIDADGNITASNVLVTDLNGYITGYGLISQIIAGEPTSDFVVVADQFSVVLPGTVDTPVVPFKAGTYHNRPAIVFANAFVGDTIQSENFDDRHGWQIKIAGDGEGRAIFSDILIRNQRGETVLDSGTGIQWDQIQGDTKPADSATRNFIFRRTTQPSLSESREGDIWYDTRNHNLWTRTGTGWHIVGNYITDTTDLTDGANFGQTAVWDQIQGYGKPQDFADQTSKNQAQSIVNQGIFATLDKITKSNVATYMDDAVIGTAFIGDLAVVSAKIGELEVGTSKIANGAISNIESAYTAQRLTIPTTSQTQIKTIQTVAVQTNQDSAFIINCSFTLSPIDISAYLMGGEGYDSGPFMWGVRFSGTGQYVFASEAISINGIQNISFSFRHIPDMRGMNFYYLDVANLCYAGAGLSFFVSNRSMTSLEMKK